jgi:Kdo2-lipid IVA lauroyltransferase/acyltransferase
MIQYLLKVICSLLDWLSLKWIQRLGACLGRLFYVVATKQNQLLISNFRQSGLFPSEQGLQHAADYRA